MKKISNMARDTKFNKYKGKSYLDSYNLILIIYFFDMF